MGVSILPKFPPCCCIASRACGTYLWGGSVGAILWVTEHPSPCLGVSPCCWVYSDLHEQFSWLWTHPGRQIRAGKGIGGDTASSTTRFLPLILSSPCPIPPTHSTSCHPCADLPAQVLAGRLLVYCCLQEWPGHIEWHVAFYDSCTYASKVPSAIGLNSW